MIHMLRITKDPNDIWGDYVELRFGYRDAKGILHVAKPVEMVEIKPEDLMPTRTEPMLSVCVKTPETEGFLQSIMDQLWEMGVRPSDIGTPGHLAATTKHLEDMRAIAFAKLDVPQPVTK